MGQRDDDEEERGGYHAADCQETSANNSRWLSGSCHPRQRDT